MACFRGFSLIILVIALVGTESKNYKEWEQTTNDWWSTGDWWYTNTPTDDGWEATTQSDDGWEATTQSDDGWEATTQSDDGWEATTQSDDGWEATTQSDDGWEATTQSDDGWEATTQSDDWSYTTTGHWGYTTPPDDRWDTTTQSDDWWYTTTQSNDWWTTDSPLTWYTTPPDDRWDTTTQSDDWWYTTTGDWGYTTPPDDRWDTTTQSDDWWYTTNQSDDWGSAETTLASTSEESTITAGEELTTNGSPETWLCAGFGKVERLQVIEVGSNLIVVWQEPQHTENCRLTYSVSVTFDEQTYSGETRSLYYAFDGNLYPCTTATITVTPKNQQNGYQGPQLVFIHVADLPVGVLNLSVQDQDAELLVTWEKPPQSEYCEPVYLIEYHDGLNHFQTYAYETHYVVSDAKLNPCTVASVTVTPKGSSKATKVLHEIPIGAVQNLELIPNDEDVLAKYDAPLKSNRCNLAYEVTYTDRDCTREATVVPVSSSGQRGLEASKFIEIELGPVRDLNLTQAGPYMLANWRSPAGSSVCDLSYTVEYSDGFEDHVSDVSEWKFIFAYLCGNISVRVTPHTEAGRAGVKSEVTFTRDC